jgi:hypothetical protein
LRKRFCHGGFAKRSFGTVLRYRFQNSTLKGLSVGGGYRYTSDRYLARVRQSPNVVGSPFVDYWQPPAKSLSFFSKYMSRSPAATPGFSSTLTTSSSLPATSTKPPSRIS